MDMECMFVACVCMYVPPFLFMHVPQYECIYRAYDVAYPGRPSSTFSCDPWVHPQPASHTPACSYSYFRCESQEWMAIDYTPIKMKYYYDTYDRQFTVGVVSGERRSV